MNPPPKKIQSFFRPKQPPAHPSSSAAFTSDPFDPLPPSSSRAAPPTPRILAVEIPPSVLRPVAFRVFTKKHNLTLKSDALALLCALVGRRCGADWRDSGTGERLLDEVARGWRRAEGAQGVLVDGGDALKSVIRALEVPGAGGAGAVGDLLRSGGGEGWELGVEAGGEGMAQTQALAEAAGFEAAVDGRRFLKVVDAFAMPKWAYNPLKRGFEKAPKPSLLPPASAKTTLFRTRYALLHQRLLRTELFLPPTFPGAATTTATTDAARQKQQQHNKLTPIANLLGRAGQSFLLFGMLAVNPSGVLTLADPTGDIVLDLSIAAAVPADGSWFAPGCFCIVDGAFEEDGRFTAYTVGQPLPERREASAEVWGHVDFLGNGITLEMGGGGGGQQGRAMRKAEEEEGVRMVFLGAVELDAKGVLAGLRRVFELLQEAPPLVVALIGSFTSIAMGTNGGSVAYKEYFDRLASLLAEFPALTEAAAFVFVPGDNDPWASTFSGGASAALPRRAVPEMFTGRVRRVFQGAGGGGGGGEAVWTSNPCRVGYFTQEIVVCRDDVVGRLRRNGVGFGKGGVEVEEGEGMDLDLEVEVEVEVDEEEEGEGEGEGEEEEEEDEEERAERAERAEKKKKKKKAAAEQREKAVVDEDVKGARKLVKTLLDQGYLSPFAPTTRPVLWDYAHALTLYPLPTALVLCEPAMQPFALTYEGCNVMNPGRLVERRSVRWIEYRPATGRGRVVECAL